MHIVDVLFNWNSIDFSFIHFQLFPFFFFMVHAFILTGHLIIQLGVFGDGDEEEDEDASKHASS